MSLASIVGAFEREVCSSRNQPRFEEAQGRHPVLALHQDMASVIALLEDRSPDHFPAKDAAIRALISERRRSSHSYCTSALMLTFLPGIGICFQQLQELMSAEFDQIQAV